MQRRELAQAIADALFAAEDAADRSLRDTSALINTLTSARLDHGLSAVLGADAMTHTAEAVASIAEARGKLVAAHQALAEAAPWVVGSGWKLTGPLTGKPDDEQRPATGRLRRVA